MSHLGLGLKCSLVLSRVTDKLHQATWGNGGQGDSMSSACSDGLLGLGEGGGETS